MDGLGKTLRCANEIGATTTKQRQKVKQMPEPDIDAKTATELEKEERLAIQEAMEQARNLFGDEIPSPDESETITWTGLIERSSRELEELNERMAEQEEQ